MQSQTPTSAASRQRPRLFYGWYIVAAGFLAQFACIGSFSSTLSVFYSAMAADIGWSRLDMSIIRSSESVFNGFASPFLGGLLDKRGARIPMVAGGIVFGAALLLLSQAHEVWQIYVIRVFLLTGGLVGMGGLAVNVTLSNWFQRQRGKAIGISSSGVSTARILVAPVMTAIIGVWGWRAGWVTLGALAWILVVIPALLIVRRRPEDMGLLPDGEIRSAGVPARKAHELLAGERTWTRRQAMATGTFWLLVVVFGVSHIGQMGFNLHSFPYLTDIGAETTLAALTISVGSITQIGGNLFWGNLTDRVDIRNCSAGQFLVQAAGLMLFMQSGQPWVAVAGYVVFCFGSGGGMVITEIIWASYFGRVSLGVVRSAGMPIMVLFSAVGPVFFGWAYGHFGNYLVSFAGFTAALMLAAVLVKLCRKPERL